MISIFVTGFARLNYNSNKDLFREIIIEFYSFGLTRNDRVILRKKWFCKSIYFKLIN